jgi:hypothetical protein
MDAMPLAGGNLTQHAKVFGYNANLSSQSIYSALFWLRNSLDLLPGNSTLIFFSDSASDDTTRKVRVLGKDSGGVAVQEELTLNGVTPVTTVTVWSKVSRVELRLVTGSALTNSIGSIAVRSSTGPTTLGYIPVGRNSATGEIDIGVENVLDGSTTIATAAAAPSGVTFSRPRTAASGLSAIGGTIAAGSGQGIWVRWILEELSKPSLAAQVALVFTGSVA